MGHHRGAHAIDHGRGPSHCHSGFRHNGYPTASHALRQRGILASGLTLCRSASTFNSQTPIVLCAGSPRHPWQRYLGFSCCAFFWPVPFAIPGQGTWASAFFQHACSPRHPWQRYFGSALGYLGGVVPQRVLRPEHPHSPPENRASRCDRSSPGSPSRTCPTRREATEV